MSTPRINVRGRSITTFIAYEITQAMADMSPGDTLEVIADRDEAIRNDLRAWTRAAGHRLMAVVGDGDIDRFEIVKGMPRKPDGTMAVVVSHDGMFELLSPLSFALASALEGMDVHVYLQGPAVRVLTRSFKPRARGWARPFSSIIRRRLADAGHVTPAEKLRELRELGGHLYACAGSMEHFKVRKDEFLFPDIEVVEYLTFADVMAHADVQMYV